MSSLERSFQVGPDGKAARAANGEPFRTFSMTASLQDEQAEDVMDDALAHLLRLQIMTFFGGWGENPWLFWRQKPEFATGIHGEGRSRELRCRLLISRNGPNREAA